MLAVNTDSKTHNVTKAVIYARVSSTKQTIVGDGLNSQITRCEEFAKHKDYEIVRVFKDDISGSTSKRPAMSEMLAYIKSTEPHVIIIDDITRFARGLDAHIQLRADVAKVGGLLESPSIEFGDDSDSQLVENLLAVVSQHQRQKNGEQVINRMRSRVMNGYCVKRAPLGYRYEAVKGRGKMLFRHEPMASIIQTMFEGYASGRFNSQSEVMRYLETLPHFPRDGVGKIRFSKVREVFSQILYAGMIEAKRWDVSLRKAQHEGIVSYETFLKVQNKLNSKAVVKARADFNADFILRGAVKCSSCGWNVTSCWSQGRSKKYPYYVCQRKGCASKGKSIARDKLETQVVDMLKDLQPCDALVKTAYKMFEDAWNQCQASMTANAKSFDREIEDVQRKSDKLIDRIVESESNAVIKGLEAKVQRLEQRKLMLLEKQSQTQRPVKSFEEQARTAIEFLLTPYDSWKKSDTYTRRAMLNMAFGGHLEFDKNTGARTAQIAEPFELIQGLKGGAGANNLMDYKMVPPHGTAP